MADAEYFDTQARRCRRMAHLSQDAPMAINLVDLAEQYEAKARKLRAT